MALRAGGAKAKGSAGERELAALLVAYARAASIDLTLSRNLEQTRSGGYDLLGLEQYGLAVEVKRVEILAVASWWGQACRQADRVGCLPVLAWRQNRKPWHFRVRAWVYPCQELLDVDLTEPQFRKWFLAIISPVASSNDEA